MLVFADKILNNLEETVCHLHSINTIDLEEKSSHIFGHFLSIFFWYFFFFFFVEFACHHSYNNIIFLCKFFN